MIGRKKLSSFIAVILSLTLVTSAWSVLPDPLPAPYDWETEGVLDTSRIKNVLQLTDAPYNDSFSGGYDPSELPHQGNAWSQDGKWIVYVSKQDSNLESDQEICKIKSDGTGFERLTTNSQSDSNASFASDDMIYFVRDTTGTNAIWRMDAEGETQTNLNITPVGSSGYYIFYRISPDAKKIAYYESGKLFVINSDGSGSPIQVSGKRQTATPGDTDLSVVESSFDWSPNSKWIVYSAYDGDGRWLYKADSSTPPPAGENTASLTKITPPAGTSSYSHYYPRWSPDGTGISYLERYTESPPGRTVYILRVIGPDGTDLGIMDTVYSDTTPGWNNMNFSFSWSPDSNWIAYSKKWSESPWQWSLFFVNTSSTPSPMQLTTGYDDVKPHWSPLGNQILFQETTWSSTTRDSGQYDDDLLLLNLYDNYGGYTFPWQMFLPAIQGGSN